MIDQEKIGGFLRDLRKEKGQTQEAVFLLDISALVPGKYSSTYTMFQKGALGASTNLDNVRGLNFETVREDEDLTWDLQHWGDVRFPDICLACERKSLVSGEGENYEN